MNAGPSIQKHRYGQQKHRIGRLEAAILFALAVLAIFAGRVSASLKPDEVVGRQAPVGRFGQ